MKLGLTLQKKGNKRNRKKMFLVFLLAALFVEKKTGILITYSTTQQT